MKPTDILEIEILINCALIEAEDAEFELIEDIGHTGGV